MNSAASQSSSAGCVGGWPLRPKSKTPGTSAVPKWRSQTWLTATRAASGLSRSAIQSRSASRRPVLVVGYVLTGRRRVRRRGWQPRAPPRPSSAAWRRRPAAFGGRHLRRQRAPRLLSLPDVPAVDRCAPAAASLGRIRPLRDVPSARRLPVASTSASSRLRATAAVPRSSSSSASADAAIAQPQARRRQRRPHARAGRTSATRARRRALSATPPLSPAAICLRQLTNGRRSGSIRASGGSSTGSTSNLPPSASGTPGGSAALSGVRSSPRRSRNVGTSRSAS